MKLAHKVIVVTGAGSGMGRALALALLDRGARVAAVDVNRGAADETARLAGGRARDLTPFVSDITRRDAVDALPRMIEERFGAVDGLINCAGIIQPFVRFAELDDAAIERVFDVNWRGTLQMTRAFLPALLRRPEAHLVNVSSMGGFLPVPGQTIYGASKAAVKLFTEGLHAELADTAVRVTLILPGAVATDIAKNSGVTLHVSADQQKYKPLTAAEAAREILDGVERDRFRVLVGKDAKLLDAMYRLSPARAAAFIAKQMKSLLAK